MITKQESAVIHYIRSLAMLCIVLCHLQQAYDNRWAWVFNVGVQIFLALSGWLYGNKNISNWRSWCKDKVLKLYVPYIIYVVLVFFIYHLLALNSFSLKHLIIYIFDLQWLLGSVKGITHLWFMTAIAVCYLLTPLLQYIKRKNYAPVCLFLLSVVGILNILVFDIYLDIFSCLFVYSFAYLFVCVNSSYRRVCTISIICSFLYSLVVIDWRILLDYSNGLNKLFYISLSLVVLLLPTIISNRFATLKVPSWVKLFDKYSYYVYITHHIFMLGPLSLAFYTSSKCLNVGLILFLTVVSSFVLKFLSDKLKMLLSKY